MEEQFRPKETVGGSSPSRGTDRTAQFVRKSTLISNAMMKVLKKNAM